jgi:hypothetical protein
MNELLNVILDFSPEVVAKLDLEKLLGSIFNFLNLFKMQNATAQSRFYIAFPHCSQLIFPLEGQQQDHKLVQ